MDTDGTGQNVFSPTRVCRRQAFIIGFGFSSPKPHGGMSAESGDQDAQLSRVIFSYPKKLIVLGEFKDGVFFKKTLTDPW